MAARKRTSTCRSASAVRKWLVRLRDRAKPTQDEKWEPPSKVDLDVAIFITPAHQKVTAENLCPVKGMLEDPVTAMWQKDGAVGYGGNFLANSPVRASGV